MSTIVMGISWKNHKKKESKQKINKSLKMESRKIKIIESKSNFDLDFSFPQAQLNDEELSKLFGGAADISNCPCKRGTLACDCYGGGVLKSR